MGQSCPEDDTRRILCVRASRNALAKEQERGFYPFVLRCAKDDLNLDLKFCLPRRTPIRCWRVAVMGFCEPFEYLNVHSTMRFTDFSL